jgi:hypothetical protein
MVEPLGDILLLRAPPRGFRATAPALGRGLVRSLIDPDGCPGRLGDTPVTCFWVGFGRKVRIPGARLMQRISQGAVSDVLDIGCAGALDPELRRGDLVLSTADLPYDSPRPIELVRREGMSALAGILARSRGVSWREAPILTHERAVLGRDERLGLFAATGCAAVQMEHAWFALALRAQLSPGAFRRLRFTHLVLITDAVPTREGGYADARASWDAVRGYLFQGGGVGALRRELLTLLGPL